MKYLKLSIIITIIFCLNIFGQVDKGIQWWDAGAGKYKIGSLKYVILDSTLSPPVSPPPEGQVYLYAGLGRQLYMMFPSGTVVAVDGSSGGNPNNANTSLSNLSNVALNANLVKAQNAQINLGTYVLPFNASFIDTGYFKNIVISADPEYNINGNTTLTIGEENTNLGTFTVTIGNLNNFDAMATYGMSIGMSNLINGNSSLIIGSDNLSDDHDTFIQGSQNGIYGMNSFVHGHANLLYADADNSFIKGSYNVLRSPDSYVFGHHNTTQGKPGQFVIGQFNSSNSLYYDPDATPRYDTNFVFIIGNGSDDNQRSNAFAVRWNGQVLLNSIRFPDGSIQNTAGSSGPVVDSARASYKSDTTIAAFRALTAISSDTTKQRLFRVGNNRGNDAFYFTNNPLINLTTPHAIGVFSRYGLSSYMQNDHIGAIRGDFTTTNLNKNYTINYGGWLYSQTDTANTKTTGREFYGVLGQVIHNSDTTMTYANPVNARLSFLKRGRDIDSAKIFYGDIESSLGTRTVKNDFAWIDIGKNENLLNVQGKKYGIKYSGTGESYFGGDLNIGGFVLSDTIIGTTTSGGNLTIMSNNGANGGNVNVPNTNYINLYNTNATPYFRTYEMRQVGNWTSVGGLQMYGRKGDGNLTVYGSVYSTPADTSASNTYGTIQFGVAVPSGVTGVLNIYKAGDIRQTAYELYTNGVAASRIWSRQYTNDRGGRFIIDTRTGSGSMVQAVLIDSSQRVLIGTSAPDSQLTVHQSMSVGSSKFRINRDGNITRINNVPYSFPSTQGAANTVLTNDGSGNLTWASVGSGSGTDFMFNEYREVLGTGDSLSFEIPSVSGYTYKTTILNGWQADSIGVGNLGIKKVGNNIIIKSNYIGDTGKRVSFSIIYRKD